MTKDQYNQSVIDKVQTNIISLNNFTIIELKCSAIGWRTYHKVDFLFFLT